MLVPHLLDEFRESVPLHKISIAIELASLYLDVVLLRNLLLLVHFERLWPLLQLLIPVFVSVSQ